MIYQCPKEVLLGDTNTHSRSLFPSCPLCPQCSGSGLQGGSVHPGRWRTAPWSTAMPLQRIQAKAQYHSSDLRIFRNTLNSLLCVAFNRNKYVCVIERTEKPLSQTLERGWRHKMGGKRCTKFCRLKERQISDSIYRL